MKPDYFDIHSHLDFKDYDKDREEVIAELKKENVWTVTVGVDFKTSEEAIKLADKHENLFATIGLHPGDNKTETFDEKEFEKLIGHTKVVAVGECGLDYARLLANAEAEKDRQKKEFERQIEFAVKYNKPLMIHCRPSFAKASEGKDAYDDILDMLNSKKRGYGDKLRGNFHFFTSPIEIAKQCLEIGFTISFAGPITFQNKQTGVSAYQDVVKYVPLERMMAETDAPLVAPVPHRGQRNNPLYVKDVIKKIAEIKNEDFEKVRQMLVDNALNFFGIKITQS